VLIVHWKRVVKKGRRGSVSGTQEHDVGGGSESVKKVSTADFEASVNGAGRLLKQVCQCFEAHVGRNSAAYSAE
jgi:hypothetical protein